ncbi:MAG: sensor histidine kinase [Betaproteobacteria bacterium]|nr:sensor histidine kinase [Betaproteobacteria bacterium]
MSTEPRTLRTQLLQWVLIPLLALLALDAFFSYGVANRFAQTAYDKALEEIARELSLQVHTGAGGRLMLELPEDTQRMLLEDGQDRVVFELVDASGVRVAGVAVAAPAGGLADGERRSQAYDTLHAGEPVRVLQRVLPAHGGAVLRVAETRNKRDELARQILAAVVLPQVVLVLLAAVLVALGVRRGLRPLADLQRDIAQSSHLERKPLDERQVPGEVRPLVASINRLLDQQDQVLRLQSRFIADAAHQLKTPVAGLKAQMELLARNPDSPDQRSIIAHLYVGMERMSRLVSQLLSLARNEPEAARWSAFQSLDLNQLVLDTALPWVPQALKRGIDLGFEGMDAPVMVQGDPHRLRELFDNLLDNAIRYSREDGKVTVRVQALPTPRVAISDDGPVIPQQERRRVFERFHRLPGSADGSGLGLAIATEIATLHRASIVLDEDRHDGVGNIFSVVFPAYPPDEAPPADVGRRASTGAESSP